MQKKEECRLEKQTMNFYDYLKHPVFSHSSLLSQAQLEKRVVEDYGLLNKKVNSGFFLVRQNKRT